MTPSNAISFLRCVSVRGNRFIASHIRRWKTERRRNRITNTHTVYWQTWRRYGRSRCREIWPALIEYNRDWYSGMPVRLSWLLHDHISRSSLLVSETSSRCYCRVTIRLPRTSCAISGHWFTEFCILADRTNGCAYATVFRPPVRLSVVCNVCIVAKRCVLQQTLLLIA